MRRTRARPLSRVALAIAAVGLAIVLWRGTVAALAAGAPPESEDHWRYWAGWHLAFSGQDPYSPEALESVRSGIPGLGPQPAVLFTPPWALPLVTPVAILPYSESRAAWFFLSLALTLGAAGVLWNVYGGSRRLVGAALVLTALFSPTLIMLRQGQIDPWILVGLAGFLHWTEVKRRDVLAGLSLALASVKPQLILGVWVAVALWVVATRRWRVALAFVAAIGASTLVVMTFDAAVWPQFVRAYTSGAVARWATPTAGFYLRKWLGPEKFWLQFLAPGAAAIFAAWYWTRHRAGWRWTAAMPALLWASILGSTYAWTYDEVVLLVPILAATVGLVASGGERRAMVWLSALLFVNVGMMVLHRWLTDEAFVWFAPALLLWWTAARNSTVAGDALPKLEGAP